MSFSDPDTFGHSLAAVRLNELMQKREKNVACMISRRLTHLSRLIKEAENGSRALRNIVKKHVIEQAGKQDDLGRLTQLEMDLMRNIIIGRTRKALSV